MNKQPTPLLVGSTFGLVFLIVIVLALMAPVTLSVQLQPKAASAAQAPATDTYTLRAVLGGPLGMSFVGVGGSIDGVTNPDLTAQTGDTVNITIINGMMITHDFTIPDFNVKSDQLTNQDQQTTVSFVATKPGDFPYFCSLPGHRQSGMEGKLHVTGMAMQAMDATGIPAAADVPATPQPMDATANGVWVIHNPADLPAPVGNRAPQTQKISLTAKEVTAQLADGVSYKFFTFNGTVPGPMIRGRVGDNFEITLHNETSSTMIHSIDLHAVNGPGGGAVYTQTQPDGSSTFTFKALNPSIFVYHCATPSVAEHISNGMYGMIVIEPEGGLPAVDKEFYVMQGELYTDFPFGTKGNMNFSNEKMLAETPSYFIFNGAANALTQDQFALRAKVGNTVRIFFGVGGPNFTSSFHVIGEIFDRVYDLGSLTSKPLTDVQTTIVPPGGATAVEFMLNVPGRYILVDHALSRMEQGLAGYLYADGPADKSIYDGTLTPGSGH